MYAYSASVLVDTHQHQDEAGWLVLSGLCGMDRAGARKGRSHNTNDAACSKWTVDAGIIVYYRRLDRDQVYSIADDRGRLFRGC